MTRVVRATIEFLVHGVYHVITRGNPHQCRPTRSVSGVLLIKDRSVARDEYDGVFVANGRDGHRRKQLTRL